MGEYAAHHVFSAIVRMISVSSGVASLIKYMRKYNWNKDFKIYAAFKIHSRALSITDWIPASSQKKKIAFGLSD